MSLFYIKNLIRDPNIGSITPTSSIAVRNICKRIDFANTEVFVEFGPGGGVFTRYILSRLKPSAQLFAFELNPSFCKYLRENIIDSRFTLIEQSADTIISTLQSYGVDKVDFVLSGIPFSLFDDSLRRSITRNTLSLIRPGGRFILYQFFPPPFNRNKRMTTVFQQENGNYQLGIELINIPPLIIYQTEKRS